MRVVRIFFPLVRLLSPSTDFRLVNYLNRSFHTASKKIVESRVVCGTSLTHASLPLHFTLVQKHNPISGAADGTFL